MIDWPICMVCEKPVVPGEQDIMGGAYVVHKKCNRRLDPSKDMLRGLSHDQLQ